LNKEVNMSYTVKDYMTKKALKKDVDEGIEVRCYQPGLGPDLSNYTGKVYLEGPHYPRPHKWYASAMLNEGVIVKGSVK